MATVTVDASWDDQATNEDGYYVYRSTTDNPTFKSDYTRIATLGVDVTSYSDTNAPSNERVYYAVTAYNGVGESEPLKGNVDTAAFLSADESDVDTTDIIAHVERYLDATESDVDSTDIELVRRLSLSASETDTDTTDAEVYRFRLVEVTTGGTTYRLLPSDLEDENGTRIIGIEINGNTVTTRV